ncbi:C-reactive protein-like [Discoglossus pictus]
MERVILWFVLFTGSLAQQDMDGKVFLFSEATATAHVVLQPTLTKPLDKLTICLRSYTELTRVHPLISVATPGPGKDNTFLILQNSNNICSIYVNNEETKIKTNPEVLDWKHTCVTWASDTGVIQLWINGKSYPRRTTKKGFSIGIQTSIVLGQEQDSFGGGFNLIQSFVGELSDVHMWDYVLSPKDIQQALFNNKHLNGNVISWRSLHYKLNGDVLVQSKLQYKIDGHELYSQCYEY